MTLETKLKTKVMNHLKNQGWMVWKISERYNSGYPDIHMLKDGCHIWLELKTPGNEPEPIQYIRLDDVNSHGGIGIWAQSLNEAIWLVGNKFWEYQWC